MPGAYMEASLGDVVWQSNDNEEGGANYRSGLLLWGLLCWQVCLGKETLAGSVCSVLAEITGLSDSLGIATKWGA